MFQASSTSHEIMVMTAVMQYLMSTALVWNEGPVACGHKGILLRREPANVCNFVFTATRPDLGSAAYVLAFHAN